MGFDEPAICLYCEVSYWERRATAVKAGTGAMPGDYHHPLFCDVDSPITKGEKVCPTKEERRSRPT